MLSFSVESLIGSSMPTYRIELNYLVFCLLRGQNVLFSKLIQVKVNKMLTQVFLSFVWYSYSLETFNFCHILHFYVCFSPSLLSPFFCLSDLESPFLCSKFCFSLFLTLSFYHVSHGNHMNSVKCFFSPASSKVL